MKKSALEEFRVYFETQDKKFGEHKPEACILAAIGLMLCEHLMESAEDDTPEPAKDDKPKP